MRAGTMFTLSDGLGALRPETPYCFLKNDATRQRVLCVRFLEKGNRHDARILTVSRDDFEDVAANTHDLREEGALELPPWHADLKGRDLAQLDQNKHGRKRSNLGYIEQRLLYLACALRDIDLILKSDNPEKMINQYARHCQPKQNEKRFRVWLLTYLCAGRNAWALCPTFQHIGHWDRLVKGKKFGAAAKGRRCSAGFPCTKEMVEDCVKAFDVIACFGKSMSKIYAEAMHKYFGCTTRLIGKRKREVYHPEGKPFPSYFQFRYRVVKHYGLEVIRRIRFGDARYRRTKPFDDGSFTENVANLMERVELDGYFCDELPRGYLEGSTVEPLSCVVIRDTLSGAKVGIGFSQGAERQTAYRMALFCAAVPKVFFCSLFGIEISDREWGSIGLSSHPIFDRGPAASLGLVDESGGRFAMMEWAPSYSGQSKATIESSHPRSTHKEGQPTYLQSDKKPIELAKQEIRRLILFNHTALSEQRMHPHPDMLDLEPSPVSLWDYFDKRGRNDSIFMSIEDAVRTFLPQVEVKINRRGISYDDVFFYHSDELRQSGAFRKMVRAAHSDVVIRAWTLGVSMRHIWLEVDSKLFMLEAHLKYQDNDALLDMSLNDLRVWKARRAIALSEFREQQHAERLFTAQQFEQETGKPFDSAKRKTGRPKKDALTKLESREAHENFHWKRSA